MPGVTGSGSGHTGRCCGYAHDEALTSTGSTRTRHRSASASRALCINPRNFQLCPETRRHAAVTRPFWCRPSHLTGGRQRLPSWALICAPLEVTLDTRYERGVRRRARASEREGPARPPSSRRRRRRRTKPSHRSRLPAKSHTPPAGCPLRLYRGALYVPVGGGTWKLLVRQSGEWRACGLLRCGHGSAAGPSRTALDAASTARCSIRGSTALGGASRGRRETPPAGVPA